MPQKQSAKFKAAIYARYSSDLQREASIDDQVRVCRERIERDGGTVVEVYSDAAISGSRASNRPGLQKLLLDAKAKRFECVVAEALDRLSRDQEDTANLFKRIRHADVRIVTLSEGEVNELHVGLKSTMNSLFLKDLAAKIKRGQRGAAEAGRIPGGKAYGYDIDTTARDAKGERIKGHRKINEGEAAIVRRIFREYVAGRAPRTIARDLNAEKIPAPRGGQWSSGTINGHPKRLFGILTNPTYAGEIVFNRVGYRKNPETGKREISTTAAAEWVRVPVPELRIVDDATWRRAQELRARFASHQPHAARRPRHLLSGLVRCGVCGGPFAVSSHSRLACITARTKSTCSNRHTITVADVTARALTALKDQMMAPDLFTEFAREWVEAQAPAGKERDERLAALDVEERKLKQRIDRFVAAIGEGDLVDELVEAARKAKARLAALGDERKALTKAVPVVVIPDNLESVFRQSVKDMEKLLTDGGSDDEGRAQLRALISEVRVMPGNVRGKVTVEVEGRAVEILALAGLAPRSSGYAIVTNAGKGGAAGGN